MRIRLFGACAALIGCAAVASAQTAPAVPPVTALPAAAAPAAPAVPPAAAPTGMTPVPTALPPSSLPAVPAAPPIMAADPSCGTPAQAAAPCEPCAKEKKKATGGLLSKFRIGVGTATPMGCSCLAAEKTFLFGSCRQFFTPGRTCNGGGIEYGPGGLYNHDNCKQVTSFLNR